VRVAPLPSHLGMNPSPEGSAGHDPHETKP
jgi:hypothetical protein